MEIQKSAQTQQTNIFFNFQSKPEFTLSSFKNFYLNFITSLLSLLNKELL